MSNNYDKNYQRVIPRDLFNEAKLLKCIGHLIISCTERLYPTGLRNVTIRTVDKFEIGLSADGHLAITNLKITLNDKAGYIFKIVYNNKSNYPLLLEHELSEYRVFNEEGEWDNEFIEFCKTIK